MVRTWSTNLWICKLGSKSVSTNDQIIKGKMQVWESLYVIKEGVWHEGDSQLHQFQLQMMSALLILPANKDAIKFKLMEETQVLCTVCKWRSDTSSLSSPWAPGRAWGETIIKSNSMIVPFPSDGRCYLHPSSQLFFTKLFISFLPSDLCFSVISGKNSKCPTAMLKHNITGI